MQIKQKFKKQITDLTDCNTKLFHNTVIQNKHRSKIFKLRKTNGGHEETRGEIEEESVQQFKNLMIEDQAKRKKDIEKINRLILRVVTQKHNEITIKARDTQ